MREPLVQLTDSGLYCPAGDFHIDPWLPVPRAIITHGHGDHARFGSERYLTATPGREILQLRLGPTAVIDTLPYRESLRIGQIDVSFHPAGHILGSSQVRLEQAGQVCVVSGDYKLNADRTAASFESVRCHHFISECTFGLPIYHWPTEDEVLDQIHAWWRSAQEAERTCILYAYSLGKAQRILAGLDPAQGPLLAHGAILKLNAAYRAAGITLPDVQYAGLAEAKATRGRALVLAPPSAAGSTWVRKFGPVSTGMASGWMQVRGMRRRKALDRGFILSDHADWDGLNTAIRATGAERIWLTHGNAAPLTRWLRESGLDVSPLQTHFNGEADEPGSVSEEDSPVVSSVTEEPAS